MGEPTEIERLYAELSALKDDLAKAKGRENEIEAARKAILSILEEMNAASAGMERARNEWETTFDAISDPIFIHDKEMRLVRCNRAYQAAAGLPFKEMLGRRYFEVFPKTGCPLKTCEISLRTAEGAQRAEEEEIALPATNKVYRVKSFASGIDSFHVHVLEDVTERRRAAERERAFQDFSRKAIVKFDFNYRLAEICRAAVQLGYKMCWAGVLDEGTKTVTPVAQAGFEEGYLSSIKVKYDDSPLGCGPTGRAIKYKRVEVQSNIATDERFAPWKEQALKRGFRSSLSIPMMDEGRVIASLNVYNEKDGFSDEELAFLRSFVNNATMYLRNARLYEEAARAAETLKREAEITRNLLMISNATANTTDIERLMEEVVKCVRVILGGDMALSYLWDGEKGAFVPSRAASLEREASSFFKVEDADAGSPFMKLAFEEGAGKRRAFKVFRRGEKTAADDSGVFQFLRWIKDLSAAVVIPLRGRNENLGMIICAAAGDNARSTKWPCERPGEGPGLRDAELVTAISAQVSMAIEEARQYKEAFDNAMELSRKVQTIQTMHEIDRAILSTLDSKDILETAVMMISRLVSCDRASVALVDADRNGLVYAAGFGIKSLEKGAFVPFEGTSASEVIRTGRPQFVANLKTVKGKTQLEKALLAEGFLSHIRVPLTVKGTVIGVLSVGAKRPSAYTPEDLSIVERLSDQIGVALENARLLSDIEELFIGTVRTLSEAIDAKSPWTRGHSDRVTKTALDIAREMGMNEKELKELELAGLLHDVGKIGTYESILNKPGKLTDEEMDMMRQHPGKDADILKPIKQLKGIIPAIRHHHESFDGTGYPDGLKGEDIPPLARILTVADTVDAMGADRPYRKGRSVEAIIAELKRCSGTQFDAKIVNAYFKTIGVK